MSDRFDLSFKNKEVRMWLYLAVPTFIVGSIIILFFDQQKYPYAPLSLLIAFWSIFYTWRFFYRRNKKKEVRKPS
ncbi:hypothetical protein [Psychrobacillus sp.]|uniref:hypothetical protein n=1 Tax=Psychrobacillus sp. TaxID=1871623 RepID=UPI0028BE1B12|nr:hypothetical protein [Psychrobacillus sp.]